MFNDSAFVHISLESLREGNFRWTGLGQKT